LAIFDDLGAIVIIALFYSTGLSIPHLVGAGVIFVLMLGMNRLRVSKIAPYLILGGVLWYLTLKSGVHATIAGVLLAFTIPAVSADGSHSPLKRLEHALHPWVAFLVLPVFAFANGGLSFESISLDSLGNPLALGVLLGLFVGKQLGVFAASWIALKARIAPMPTDSTWGAIYGVSLITGIGFTMSLFIGALAFPDSPLAEVAKAGTIVGSLLSAAAGYLVLRIASARK
jgi:NhaA family Na+:H+ antiporter